MKHKDAFAAGYYQTKELLEDRQRLRYRLAAIINWLEQNESSVFRRGLWDAINEADARAKEQAHG